MNGSLRILLSIFVMTTVVIGSISLSLFSLYRAALEEEEHRLRDAVQGQAEMMEAMARFNAGNLAEEEPKEIAALTLEVIGDAFGRFDGFGKSGEFILAKMDGEKIVFLLSQRPESRSYPQSVPLSSTFAEPMRRALTGESGAIVTRDYFGEKILAAYQSVGDLGYGLVAKMDLDEIRSPFIRAALIAATGALCFVFIGSAFFWNLIHPLLRRLKESEVKYRSIFENSPNSIFLMTDVFEDCNEEACRLWACQREDIIGHSPWEFSPTKQPGGEDSAAEARKRINAAISGSPQFFYWHHYRKDGVSIDTEVLLKAIEVEGRKIVLAIMRDITQRKRAEAALRESEERVRLLLNSTAEGIYGLDLEGNCTFCNPSALRFLGYRNQGDLLGKNLHELIHHTRLDGTPYPVEECRANRGFREGEGVHNRDDVFWRADGTSIPVEYWSFPVLKEGEVLGAVVTFLDITERKRRENQLHDALSELKDVKKRLEAENVYLKGEIELDHDFSHIIGQSDVFKRVLKQIEQVARTDATVLILGETGTGKELLAHAVHNLSPRMDRPLVKVNCAALPANLIESELFGHEKGAFTGATSRKVGRFELAQGGTIFLDEIGDLPLELQAKLLRVLQEGEFERVGGTSTIKVDVRVIAATNQDLEKAMAEHSFRQDLYYRLNIFPIHSPPLRERAEDIPALVRFFIQKYGRKIGKRVETVPKNIMDSLQTYHWPGNVRELENVIERSLIISREDQFTLADSLRHPMKTNGKTGVTTLVEMEKQYIAEVLEATGWRVSGRRGAAEILGLKPTTLEAKMKKLGIRRKEA